MYLSSSHANTDCLIKPRFASYQNDFVYSITCTMEGPKVYNTFLNETSCTIPLLYLLLFTLLSTISLFCALSFGAVALSLQDISQALLHFKQPSIAHTIIWELRLPRVINAYLTGGLLALSGVLMQALLRNPLADPYILGVSGGAAVATLVALLLGFSGLVISSMTFLGALLAIVLVFMIAQTPKQWSPLRLLLTGVILSSAWGALISFILTISPQENLPSFLFWLIGNVQQQHISYVESFCLLVGLMGAMYLAPSLNIFCRGQLTALSLGVNVKRTALWVYLLSALLTAAAVSVAGTIGFIGLVVPHILRMTMGTQHQYLIPGSVLLGGSLLCVADTLARTLVAPIQLPTGIFTVFIGVPVFLVLLHQQSKTYG